MTEKTSAGVPKVMHHTLAGTCAGLIEATIMHPCDTLKTRMQIQTNSATTSSSRNIVSNLLRNEGILALYKGFIPVCSVIAPKVGLQFTGLAFFKKTFDGLEAIPKSMLPVFAGISTGILQATLLLTPFELVKVRQQTELGKSRIYKGQLKALSHIIMNEGVFALYKGLFPTIARQSWGLIIKFSGYEGIKGLLDDWNGVCSGEKSPIVHHTIAGGVANIFVAFLNSPPDVIKTRMQNHNSKYSNTWDCACSMYKNEGIVSFFRGSWLRLLRIAPGGAIQFSAYGYFSTMFE